MEGNKTKRRQMSKEHRRLLIHNRIYILENLSVDEVFLSHLLQAEIITTEHAYEIKSKLTPHEKVGHLMDILPRRGPDAFKTFISALRQTAQQFIAQTLIEKLKGMRKVHREEDDENEEAQEELEEEEETVAVEIEEGEEEDLFFSLLYRVDDNDDGNDGDDLKHKEKSVQGVLKANEQEEEENTEADKEHQHPQQQEQEQEEEEHEQEQHVEINTSNMPKIAVVHPTAHQPKAPEKSSEDKTNTPSVMTLDHSTDATFLSSGDILFVDKSKNNKLEIIKLTGSNLPSLPEDLEEATSVKSNSFLPALNFTYINQNQNEIRQYLFAGDQWEQRLVLRSTNPYQFCAGGKRLVYFVTYAKEKDMYTLYRRQAWDKRINAVLELKRGICYDMEMDEKENCYMLVESCIIKCDGTGNVELIKLHFQHHSKLIPVRFCVKDNGSFLVVFKDANSGKAHHLVELSDEGKCVKAVDKIPLENILSVTVNEQYGLLIGKKNSHKIL